MSMKPFALVLAMSLSSLAHAATLGLVPRVLVSQARVTLADVVEPSQASAGLAQVDLGAAPLPGYTLHLSRAQVERELRTRGLAFALADGPSAADAVTIERVAQTVAPELLVARADQALREAAVQAGVRLETRVSGLPAELPVPTGKLELTARPLPAGRPWQRRGTVWVDIAVDGVFVRTVPLTMELQAWGPALTAAIPLPAGAPLRCESTAVREVELTALVAAPVNDCRALTGQLRHGVNAGDAILPGMLARHQDVAAGDQVQLTLVSGMLRLEAKAVALAPGSAGDSIAVRTQSSTQPLRALITGPGTARILE